jgi:hypothetical protein
LAWLLPFLNGMTKAMIRFNWDNTSVLPYEPDILASQQYLKNYRRRNPVEPEKALLFAVLVEAVKTYQGFAFSESPRKQKLFREAKEWLWGEEPESLFSFRSICGVFGIDPAFLRRGLMQWAAERKRSASCRKKVQLRSGAGRTRNQVITLPHKGFSETAREHAGCEAGIANSS